MNGKTRVPASLLIYKVEKPEAKHIYKPWEDSEVSHLQEFLVRGSNLLAECDPTWNWYERMRRICHSWEFRSRMRALSIYLCASRTLTRYAEIARLIVDNWDFKHKILTLDPDKCKAKPKKCLVDDELAWFLDVLTVNRGGSELIFLAPKGGEWDPNSFGRFMTRIFDESGLKGKLPYELKFTGASLIYDRPEEFTDQRHEERLARVRAITGHSVESHAVERYIKARWGNTYGKGSQVYYNNHPILPFKVSDYPICRLKASS